MRWFICFLVITQGQLSYSSRYDAYFMDRMVGFYKETIMMSELAQKKSTNLDLKKVSRKIMRENKRQIKRIREWRNTYYEEIPDFWVVPSIKVGRLRKLEGKDFDLQYLRQMLQLYQEGYKRLQVAQEKGDKAFIISFSKNRLKQFDKHMDMLKKLRDVILKS